MELTYKEVYTMNPTDARKRIVQTYYQTGSKGARPCAPPARRHSGTHPSSSCASGCNATNRTANKDCKTTPELPDTVPRLMVKGNRCRTVKVVNTICMPRFDFDSLARTPCFYSEVSTVSGLWTVSAAPF